MTSLPPRSSCRTARSKLPSLLLGLALVAGSGSAADAAGIAYQHAGATDPTTEGWSWSTNNDLVVREPVTDDQGVPGQDAYRIADPGGSNGSFLVTPTDEEIAEGLADGWALRALLRVVLANDEADYSVGLEYANEIRRYTVQIGATQGHPVLEFVQGPTLRLTDLDAGYHLYELVYDPEFDHMNLYVDGVLRHSGYQGSSAQVPAAGKRIFFGSGCTSCTGEANWAAVEWELGVDTSHQSFPASSQIPLDSALLDELSYETLPYEGAPEGWNLEGAMAASDELLALVNQVGGVDLYVPSGDAWVFATQIHPRDLYQTSGVQVSGSTVFIHGRTDVLSNPLPNNGTVHAVSIYGRVGEDRWEHEASLVNSYQGGPASPLSNWDLPRPLRVRSDGTTLAIVNYYYYQRPQTGGDTYSSVILWRRTGDTWAQVTKTVFYTTASCLYQTDLAIADGEVLVGGCSKVVRYQYNGGWSNVGTVPFPAGHGSPQDFGAFLGADDQRLAIYDSGVYDDGYPDARIFFFDRIASNWLFDEAVSAGAPRQLDIELRGSFLLAATSGTARLFEEREGSWDHPTELAAVAADPGAGIYGDYTTNTGGETFALNSTRAWVFAFQGDHPSGVAEFGSTYANAAGVANAARRLLYPDAAENPGDAAFRYLDQLFVEEDGKPTRQVVQSDPQDPDRVMEIVNATLYSDQAWGPDEREASGEAECLVRKGLEATPDSAELAELLLDIHYHRLSAELIIANAIREGADNLRILTPTAPTDYVLDVEIAALEQAREALFLALDGAVLPCVGDGSAVNHFTLLESPELVDGVDREGDSGEPFGYALFETLVPTRGLAPATYLPEGGGEAQAVVDIPGNELFPGYKDLVLILRALRGVGEASKELAKLHHLRGLGDDEQVALDVISDTQTLLIVRGLQLEGLLADGPTPDPDSQEAIDAELDGYRAVLGELTELEQTVRVGGNPLGFEEDALMLVDDRDGSLFDSFDIFQQVLVSDTPVFCTALNHETGLPFLSQAECDYETALDAYAAARYAQDELQSEYLEFVAPIDAAIWGIGDENTVGRQLWQQRQNIDAAALRIERNGIEISNLEERIRIEVERAAEVNGIRDLMANVHIDYGNKQAALTKKIAKIKAAQEASKAAKELFSLKKIVSGEGFLTLVNGAVQTGAEIAKGDLEAEKEQLAGMQSAEIVELESQVLMVNSKAQIKTWLLEMNTLAIDSKLAAVSMRQELGQYVHLVNLEEALQQKKARFEGLLDDRYFGDPVHQARSRFAMQRADDSFALAQEWLFYMARSLEYKWIREYREIAPADRSQFSVEKIFRLRNARELSDFYDAMVTLDDPPDWVDGLPEARHTTFSLRQQIFDYPEIDPDTFEPIVYIDPDTQAEQSSVEAFREFLTDHIEFGSDCDGTANVNNDVTTCIVLEFGTVRRTGSFFSTSHFADKIDDVTIRIAGEPAGPNPIKTSAIEVELLYGGSSLLRTPDGGYAPDSQRPDLVEGEIQAYTTRNRFSAGGPWQTRSAKRGSIQILAATNEGTSGAFQERSVATTSWRLMIPLVQNALGVVSINDINDIEVVFDHFVRIRQ